MLGPTKLRRLGEPIAVSCEALIPATRFYHHLETKLDLSFNRDWTRKLYAKRGRPSIDPVVFFKPHRVIFFEGIRSERQIVRALRKRKVWAEPLFADGVLAWPAPTKGRGLANANILRFVIAAR